MKKKRIDWTYICTLTITLSTVIIVILYITYINRYIKLPECIIVKTFGIYCPGCGATRAVYSLYDGKILQAIYYNPFIIYLVIIDMWYLITEGIAKIINKENKLFLKNIKIYIYIGLIILVLNWITKILLERVLF